MRNPAEELLFFPSFVGSAPTAPELDDVVEFVGPRTGEMTIAPLGSVRSSSGIPFMRSRTASFGS
jgi:hypothetical protein